MPHTKIPVDCSTGIHLFSGNTFYHEKGKAIYHFGKSSENRDFIKFSGITPKNRYFGDKLSLKYLFQRVLQGFKRKKTTS